VPSFHVIGFIDGWRSCRAIVKRECPDVVVVDITATETALARVTEIRAAAPVAKIVLLTARMDPQTLDDAVLAGADAVIAKSSRSAATVGVLIYEVAAGNVYHSFTRTASPARESHGAGMQLTARELEILQLVASGMSNARIAAALYVAEQTVKFHLTKIYRKLGLANRTEASHYAHVNGLLGFGTTASAPVRHAPDAIVVAA
jgi:DNA-binding NarL/FixJ family response regulator